MYKKPSESGFALLITLIVVGVVVSVGLSILDLTVKQVKLSTTAKESELAFHAANAGMECARYWRRVVAYEMENGQDISPTCFDGVASNPSTVSPNTGPEVPTGSGDAFLYEYEFTWGGAEPRCTQVSALVASSTVLAAGVTVDNVVTLIPGYPEGSTMTCDSGNKCSVVSVRGYNKACSKITDGFGIVQREVLLQF